MLSSISTSEMEVTLMNDKITKIIFTGLFAALTCVATMVVRIPSFGSVGYVNIGDTLVLISGWLLGGLYGALAAGVGSALCDLLGGYGYYVPGTLIIKFTMALVAYLIYKKLKDKNLTLSLIVSGISAEIIMVVGYFFYKALILGRGWAAAVPSVFSNIVQGVTCLILGYVLFFALEKANIQKLINIGKSKEIQ